MQTLRPNLAVEALIAAHDEKRLDQLRRAVDGRP